MKTKLPTQSLRRQKAVKPDASKITIDSRLVLRVVFFFFWNQLLKQKLYQPVTTMAFHHFETIGGVIVVSCEQKILNRSSDQKYLTCIESLLRNFVHNYQKKFQICVRYIHSLFAISVRTK